MSIGERIIALRKEADLSQNQLAKLLEVTRQAVSKWENDQSSPDTLKLIQLADVLNTDVEYLATGKRVQQPEPTVIKTVEVQEKVIEKIVEKPVKQIVEKPVTRFVERVVERPVVTHVTRVKYLRNPVEFGAVGLLGFILGVLVGFLL